MRKQIAAVEHYAIVDTLAQIARSAKFEPSFQKNAVGRPLNPNNGVTLQRIRGACAHAIKYSGAILKRFNRIGFCNAILLIDVSKGSVGVPLKKIKADGRMCCHEQFGG